MINEYDAFPFVFRENNDESAYIDYQEIANRDKKNSKADIDNNQVLPLLDKTEKLKSIKEGSKDSIPVSGQSANTESYVYDEKIYNVINKAYNEMAGMINQKSNIDNIFKKSFENVQSVARASIEEKNMFDIDKYNKNYTEMAIKAFKDNKDRLTNTDKPIHEEENTLTIKLICRNTHSDKEIAEYFANLKVGDKVKIKNKELCGLWGKYNYNFCGKWGTIKEICQDYHYVLVRFKKLGMEIIDLFVVQVMAIKEKN